MKRALMYLLVATGAACGGSNHSSFLPDPDGAVFRIARSGDAVEAAACTMTLPATLEAEDARPFGVTVAKDRAGFQGSGYLAGFAEVGDRISFPFCLTEAGYYTVEFRYATGAESVATRTLLVDGKPFPVAASFPPMASATGWSTGGRLSMFIDAGAHEMALTFESTDKGDVQLDAMTLDPGPSASQTSARSLFMNDWQNLVVAWHAAQIHPSDKRGFGPRMTALHSHLDWPTNQLDEAQAFLRDDTAGTAYDDPNQLETRATLGASEGAGYGQLDTEYGPYGGKALPVAVTRHQIVPPGKNLVVVTYDLANVSDVARDFSLLEWADLHNKTAGPSEDPADTGMATAPSGTLQAAWHSESNAWVVDMTATNGTAVVVGAFDGADHHLSGAPVTGGPDRTAAAVQQFFNAPAALVDNDGFTGEDAGVGLAKTVHLAPGERTTLAFFYTVTDSVDAASAAATSIHGGSPAAMLAAGSSTSWKDWLDSGKAGSAKTPVPAWGDALRATMITLRQAQQPEFGTFVASTNPAYFYSIWPRDSSVTAMALDAAGYLAEGEKYWTWMAAAQETGTNADYPRGSYYTNYNYWHQVLGIRFVYPEWDSSGLFLVGVYQHHQALAAIDAQRASAFLSQVWPAVQGAATFIQQGTNDPSNHGFGWQDNSIWEEDLAYHTFTQTTYVAGLRAAELLATAQGQDGSAWGASSDQIRSAIFRPSSVKMPCPGLWNDQSFYFNRSVKPDCTLDTRVDSSTQLLWVLGVLAQDDLAASEHRRAILFNLSPGEWGHGIARYQGDEFYHSNPASPGGTFEAQASMPVWPQPTMDMAMLEHWHGLDALAADRLSWDVATTPAGFVPQGEAVDWSTQQPIVSTAAEPVTGGWFAIGLLNQLGLYDPRLPQRDSWGPVASTPYPRY